MREYWEDWRFLFGENGEIFVSSAHPLRRDSSASIRQSALSGQGGGGCVFIRWRCISGSLHSVFCGIRAKRAFAMPAMCDFSDSIDRRISPRKRTVQIAATTLLHARFHRDNRYQDTSPSLSLSLGKYHILRRISITGWETRSNVRSRLEEKEGVLLFRARYVSFFFRWKDDERLISYFLKMNESSFWSGLD